MHLSAKKLLLSGFIFVLLLAIPITVYLVKQQQTTQSSAVAATTLSFSPTSPSVKLGQNTDLDIFVDPSNTNAISYIKIILSYDSTKLATASGGVKINSWTVSDGTTFTPSLAKAVEYTPNAISFAINLGTNPQNLISTKTKIATVTFNTIAPTEQDVPTQVIFANQTQVLSAGQNVVNVLSSSAPANITVTQDTPSSTPTLTPTVTPTIIALTPTPISTSSGSASESAQLSSGELICESLTVDPNTLGTAPFSVNLTAVGSSSSSAITKVSFDFGDSNTQDVTDAGGVGTDAVSVLVSHTYATSGTFSAKATLTDEDGNVTNNGCSATILVGQASTVSSTPTEAAPSPLPPTGPTGSIIAVGALGALLFLIGAVVLLAL
ncbi:MAG: hypothetical protein A2798_00890 [Candidatus Levybacteria bacterium RIFCSPHIGHO2_01_FULL_37_17]|nr:MAG: hypothetical protein A2798_00890 [Candidatus Levybacteria bacterium RIFCSPHIGHO2_01_FULL_37_17]OGH37007.1 MAG: hypothetical protein A2959_01750 [Candidatus Levybacteria bacterium RIFCSPLOWO2_01_FULL_38_23]